MTTDISSRYTLKHEIDPLLAIRGAYLKVIIARTRHDLFDNEDVQILDIVRWLMSRKGFGAV